MRLGRTPLPVAVAATAACAVRKRGGYQNGCTAPILYLGGTQSLLEGTKSPSGGYQNRCGQKAAPILYLGGTQSPLEVVPNYASFLSCSLPFSSLARGRTTVMRVPMPSREMTSKWPPWRSTIHLAMARPKPVPPVWRARDWSVR